MPELTIIEQGENDSHRYYHVYNKRGEGFLRLPQSLITALLTDLFNVPSLKWRNLDRWCLSVSVPKGQTK